MANELRKTGISILGDIPWGTHFSLLCETTQDFLDILIPYFKAGLENNEFCMWVISDPLDEAADIQSLCAAMFEIDHYLAVGQLAIISHTDWYLKGGMFDQQAAISGCRKSQVQGRGSQPRHRVQGRKLQVADRKNHKWNFNHEFS